MQASMCVCVLVCVGVCMSCITHSHTSRCTIKDQCDGRLTKCVRFERLLGCKCPRPLVLVLCCFLVLLLLLLSFGANERIETITAAFNTIYWQYVAVVAAVEKFSPQWKNYAAGRQKCAQLQQQQQNTKRAAHKKKCEMEKHIKKKREIKLI